MVIEIMGISLIIFCIETIIFATIYEKQEKKKIQNMSEEDYKKKWDEYVNLVNDVIKEKNYERDKLNNDWIQTFDKCIHLLADNGYLLNRMFNDFDIAACLIYSLTYDKNTDENILFSFECAKRIFSEPKEYIRDMGYGYKLDLIAIETFKKVDICLPDEIITSEVLTTIIRAYFMQNTENGIIQLSDFLHILYLKCK
jgi:hypothetical protein